MTDPDLTSMLLSLRVQIESGIKKQLSGPLNAGKRFIYDSITPIRLNVVGDSEECNMQFLAGGNVAVHTGLDSAPDVTVKGSLETLSNVIYQKSSRVFEEAEQKAAIVVTTHTWKGQQVMQQLRQILGSSS